MKDVIATLVQIQVKSDQAILALQQGKQTLQQGQHTLQQGYHSLQQSMSKIELQMGQMAKELSERPKGALPSQVEKNPRYEQAKVITILRSDKVYNNKIHYDPSSYLNPPSSYTPIHENLDYDYIYKEEGNQWEKNVPLKNGVKDVVTLPSNRTNKGVDKGAGGEENVTTGGVLKTHKPSSQVQSPSTSLGTQAPHSSSFTLGNKQGIPLGKGFGQLSVEDEFDKRDYAKRKKTTVTFEETHKMMDPKSSRDGSHSGGKLMGGAMES
jgi:hypothetical protein